jgi:hypothetical protein
MGQCPRHHRRDCRRGGDALERMRFFAARSASSRATATFQVSVAICTMTKCPLGMWSRLDLSRFKLVTGTLIHGTFAAHGAAI